MNPKDGPPPTCDNVLTISGNGSTPVMKLNQDVLWRIFSMNANMDNDEEFRVYSIDKLNNIYIRALFTTWHSAQVCQLWRDTLLNTPYLWAQLIDLDGLSSADGSMKDEVMRRTGSSPLSVAGRVFVNIPGEQDFFLNILQRDWTRIRSLKVTISQSRSVPRDTWRILSKPTKVLECFKLKANDGINPPDQNRPIRNLFANYAPSLKSFMSWKINIDFGIGTNTSWLSNIRQLDISYMTSMSLLHWLQALEKMPLLEDLQLIYPFSRISTAESELQLPSVHLPRLLNICITHDLKSCTVFLDRIVPGVGCYLYLDTPDDVDEPPAQSTFNLATKVLSRYSQNWLANHPISTLLFTVSHAAITISEYRNLFGNPLPMFGVYLCCGDPDNLPSLFPLLDAYASCNFSSVETLRFNVDIFPAQSLNSDVFRFLLNLRSVKSLTFWTEGTIPSLHSLARDSMDAAESSSDTSSSLFPHLHTIKVDGLRSIFFPSYIEGSKEIPLKLLQLQENISKFVIWRRVMQAPVEVVDITDLGGAAKAEIFDGIPALQVLTEAGV